MAKNEAVATLYRVNYQYIAPNAQLRTGAVVVEATSQEQAKEIAIDKIRGSTHDRGARIVSVKNY